jgi:hypothetical protein
MSNWWHRNGWLVLMIGCIAGVSGVGVWAVHSQAWGLVPCYERAFIVDGQCVDYRHTLERDGWHWVCRCRED